MSFSARELGRWTGVVDREARWPGRQVGHVSQGWVWRSWRGGLHPEGGGREKRVVEVVLSHVRMTFSPEPGPAVGRTKER
jgi:hypothetical protein